MTPKEQAVIDAALMWALCPDAGGYRHTRYEAGPAIEDTCERLTEAVVQYLGKDIHGPKYPNHWTVAQMRRAVEKQLRTSREGQCST